jgi:ATP-dependent Clp protease ATP-binding subunit ClpA
MPLRTALADSRLIAALLTTAEAEARALGDPEPAAEHLLLAALLIEDPSAREALSSVAPTVDAAAVRTAIGAVHAASLTAVGISTPELDTPLRPARGIYRSEVSAQEVFQRARVLSRHSRKGLLAAHVLLAAAEREHGTVARVLDHLGLERAAVTEAAAAVSS